MSDADGSNPAPSEAPTEQPTNAMIDRIRVDHRARRDALVALEAVIQRGLDTFLEVGRALATINEERLYLATHATFDDYCRARWGFSRSYAHDQIRAAQLHRTMQEIGVPEPLLPRTERHARALLPLAKRDPAKAAEVLRALGPDATAADVERKVGELEPALDPGMAQMRRETKRRLEQAYRREEARSLVRQWQLEVRRVETLYAATIAAARGAAISAEDEVEIAALAKKLAGLAVAIARYGPLGQAPRAAPIPA